MDINVSNPTEQASSRAQSIVKEQNQDIDNKVPVDSKTKKRNDELKSETITCKNYRRKLVANWSVSVDYRRGKPFTSQTDDDQVAVNLDWINTKAKQAALFSQVPQVRLSGSPQAAQFEQKLNNNLIEAGIESAMDECLPDCINASGLGSVIVSYEAITEDRQIPKHDPSTLAEGEEQEFETIPVPVDTRYVIERVSPADFLWPINFTGSNFDKAPFVGRSGRIRWADAQRRFNLPEEDKEAVLGEDRTFMDKLTHDVERDKSQADQMVNFDELFIREYLYDPEAKNFDAIRHIVFIAGKDDPVIDEPWKGQRLDEGSGNLLGSTKFPIRVLTLTYITDEAIPPSDSAIGRPQVNEINKARTQMIRQRERSLPVRWFDVNRLDPAIQQSLMRGTWQAMIPVQGEGTRVIGEVSKASMPQENFLFDQIAKKDLSDEWSLAKNPDDLDKAAKGDPNQNHSSFNTQAGRERAKVASFFCSIAEVLGGLMCLYEDPKDLGEGFKPEFGKTLKFSILADSTVLLDAGQKLSRLNQFINTYAKSGWINIEPVLKEVASLSGLDPNIVVKAPAPKPPVEPNISLRLTGVEDMLNPLTLAFLIKSGQAPSPELIEQAKQLIQQTVVPPQPPASEQGSGGPEGAPPTQGLPPGIPQGVGGPMPPPHPGPQPGGSTPPPQPPRIGEAHPNWTTLPSLDKRTEGNQK
jgi:hypothetical protein